MDSVADNLYVTEQEKEIVDEFCYLLNKSRQLFNGLRDLQTCSGNAWMPHFFRTFEVFTKLWKFQQQNRSYLTISISLPTCSIPSVPSGFYSSEIPLSKWEQIVSSPPLDMIRFGLIEVVGSSIEDGSSVSPCLYWPPPLMDEPKC
ncbi:hypothetical protein D918_03722 [Trichuris suis]|nr:hypothetical protein D918_03722 [Trichuris suis]